LVEGTQNRATLFCHCCSPSRVAMHLCHLVLVLVGACTAEAFQVPISCPTARLAHTAAAAVARRPSLFRARGPTTVRAGLFDGLFGGAAPTPGAAAKETEPVPTWTELLDEASSKPYYWNELTGETSWVPPPTVLQTLLPNPGDNNQLSDEAYYRKITAQADASGGTVRDFGDIQQFPVMYDGWFATEHEWMGADGETPRKVSGDVAKGLGRQIEAQMVTAVQAALADGVTRMEVRFDCVPNLEEVDLGTALNQKFSVEIREDMGLGEKKYKTEIRRNLVDWANHHWARKLAAALTSLDLSVFIQHCSQTDFSKANTLCENIWVGRLGRAPRILAAGDVGVVVNPGVEDQWKKALTFSAPDSPLIYLNSISGGWTYELGGPIKEAEQIYYMKRVSKGWIFRCYPGPWQALVERPDGSVQVLATYEKRPLLRDASKVVREYSFEKFAIFNDRYAKGFGGRL